MRHGASVAAARFGDETVGAYFARLGPGGEELLARVLAPGLRAALGGDPARSALFVLLQVVWNTLGAGFWNLDGGVDRLPEALAREVPVRLGTSVESVRLAGRGVEVDVVTDGARRTLGARRHPCCAGAHPVSRRAQRMRARPRGQLRASRAFTSTSRSAGGDAGCAFVDPAAEVGEEGSACSSSAPARPGALSARQGMVSVYFVDGSAFAARDVGRRSRKGRACWPRSTERSSVGSPTSWLARGDAVPPGRLAELVTLRSGLARDTGPIDLAGDWLDGVASESALCTGEQAAARVARRLRRAR
jgi:hypothetical protein